MPKLKILWMSNRVQTGTSDRSTGGWLAAMADGLLNTGEIELANISRGMVEKITRQDYRGICQWVVPYNLKLSPHVITPSNNVIKELVDIVNSFSPDLIHVWGTEDFWGLLTARKYFNKPALLEMQGLKGAIARVFHGGLSSWEQIACIGLKEILRGSTIFQFREQYRKWGFAEQEIIAGNRFITSPSPWMEAQVKAVNNDCTVFHNELALQKPFYVAEPWERVKNHTIFSSASYPSPFKGIHVVIRALAILKKRFPDIKLRIAGAHQRKGLRQDGFVVWLNQEAKRLNVEANISWLGPLTAEEIASELQNCAVCVLPTFIESYCLALAEAMMVGTPTVVSFTGGTSFLSRDQESALFFPPGDEAMCAYHVERLLTDQGFARHISCQAREIAVIRHDYDRIVRNQIEIYRRVINEFHTVVL